MVICIVQHICLLGLLATTHSYLFNTAGRRGAKRRQEPESSHRTGHPGQTTPWEGKHWGWQEGERCRSLSSCDDVHDWRKPSRGKLLTLFLFRDAQRQTEAAGNTAGCLWVTEGFFSSQWGFSRLFNYCWKLVSTIYQLTSKPRDHFCG